MCTVYVGMDIHKNFIHAVAVDEQGAVVKEQRLTNSTEDIQEFMESLDGSIKAAIESTCTWMRVYETLEELGIETTLVNVRRTKVIAEAKIKTDKLDALSIAQCLRTGFIARAWIPPKHVRELRNIVRHRLSLRKEITRNKNKVHSILLRNGIQHKFSDIFGRAGLEFLENLELGGSEGYRLDSYLRLVSSLMREKELVTRKIELLCRKNEQAMLLTSVPGIGYYSAMVLVSEIGDIGRFASPKKLCSYAGLVPRTIQSGSHVFRGRILRECNQNLKWILTQCVHIHTRFCEDSSITRLYYRVMRKKGKNKAVIAAARKLLTVIWAMLMHNELFRGSI